MRKTYLIIALVLMSTQSFGSIPLGKILGESALSRNGFGPSNRAVALNSKNKLGFSFIGRLAIAKGGYCTASLVGEDLILTNAHCIAKNGEVIKGSYVFQLGYNRGQMRARSLATIARWGSLNTNINRGSDWAILKLAKPLGKKFGYFGISRSPDTTLKVNIAGYGNMFSSEYLSSHEGCNFRGFESNYLLHDCDTSSGDSGSPMFSCTDKGCFIKGLHAAEKRNGAKASAFKTRYDPLYANVAVQTYTFADTVVRLKRQSK